MRACDYFIFFAIIQGILCFSLKRGLPSYWCNNPGCVTISELDRKEKKRLSWLHFFVFAVSSLNKE